MQRAVRCVVPDKVHLNVYWRTEYYLPSTLRNYTLSEPRFRAVLAEGAIEQVEVAGV